jgi:hypothetical protein
VILKNKAGGFKAITQYVNLSKVKIELNNTDNGGYEIELDDHAER